MQGFESMDALLLAARLILAAVFLVSGIAKLFDLSGSQAAMRSFGVPDSMAKSGGVLLPLVEIALAVLLVPVTTAKWGALLAFLLLVVFIAGVGYNLARGRKFECQCFGQLTRSEIGPSTLIRNLVLAVLALYVAYNGFTRNTVGPAVSDWLRGLSTFEWIMLVVGVAVVAALAAISWLLVHLLGQNGRLLVRLDRIESALEDADIAISDEDEEEEEEEEEEGLPFGAPAPAFSLSGLYGETMTLDALRAAEKPVLLVFSDPSCGPCNALMSDVGKWQHDLADKLTVAVVSRGSLDDNRQKKKQYNLTTVLMQQDSEIADAYVTNGTPTAVLVSPDGTIASAAAGGGDDIRTLVKQAVEGRVPIPAPRPVPAPGWRRSRCGRRPTRRRRAAPVALGATRQSSSCPISRARRCAWPISPAIPRQSSSGIRAAGSASAWPMISRPGSPILPRMRRSCSSSRPATPTATASWESSRRRFSIRGSASAVPLAPAARRLRSSSVPMARSPRA